MRPPPEFVIAGVVSLAAACGDAKPPARANPPAAAAKPQTGEASYYAKSFAGKPTASGAPFRPDRMVAAHRTLPLGARAKVTNLETGKSVAVTVADRGPYAENRIIDVSPKAADKLDMKHDGVAPVQVQPLRP